MDAHAVCTDWEDNIYIADQQNNIISIFDKDDKFIQQISVFKPLALCLTRGKIIVASGDSVGIYSN